MKQLPVFKVLSQHLQQKPISFHVPGHKNGLLLSDFLPNMEQVLQYDLTELSGLDDLHSPEEAIAQAQQLLTSCYRTKKSYFLVNGSTAGNLAMVLSTVKAGDRVFVQRNCHKSIFNALQLAGAQPIFLRPEIDHELATTVGVSLEVFKQAIADYPDTKVAIFTYPNYYGQTFNIKEMIDFAHQHDLVVLVDEAHGAHFIIGEPFPASSLLYGADMVVHSAHKTLPAMTMASFLHINSERVSIRKVSQSLGMLQSSSPSYPLMLSLDIAREYVASFTKNDVAYLLQQIEQFHQELMKLPMFQVIQTDDPIKLLLKVTNQGLSGFELQKLLEAEGIFTELADHDQVLLILPLLKVEQEYPFEEALRRIKKVSDRIVPKEREQLVIPNANPLSTLALSYTEMEELVAEPISFDQLSGRIAAETIIPYPPGIPLVIRGELITSQLVQQLKQLFSSSAKVQGGEAFLLGKVLVFSFS